jgi:hypothetical protein
MCDAYGWDDPSAIVDEIAALLQRARDRHANRGRRRAVVIFEELMRWMARHGEALRDSAARPPPQSASRRPLKSAEEPPT